MDAVEVKLKAHSERTVVMGLIVSQAFCARIIPMMQYEAFSMDFIRVIVNWSVDYFKQYGEPIGTNIQSKFEAEIDNINEDDVDLIQAFLVDVSKDYERIEKHFNDTFYIDQAIKFFRKNTIRMTKQKLESCLETNKIDEAFEFLGGVKEVMAETSNVTGLYLPDEIPSFFDADDGRKKGLLQVEGHYGKLLGSLNRGNLIAFLAPMKRGKTWILLDLAYRSILSGLNTLYISHEMSEKETKERMYQIITGRSWDDNGVLLLPHFDCALNQNNLCTKRERQGGGQFGTQLYKPCSYCRTASPKDYIIESYNIPKKVPPMTPSHLRKKMDRFEFMYGRHFRMRCATFGSTWPVVKSTVETLINIDNFFPDVVLEDYINIRAPYKFGMSNINKIDMIDMNWKETKSYATGRGILWITVHQGVRSTLNKKTVRAGDTSGFIDIVAHVNKLFGLNQTRMEKARGIMRINTIANRSEKFDEDTFCTVLQSLEIGRPILDSQFGIIKSAYNLKDGEEGE